MIQLCSLFSGSGGNCTYVENDGAGVLVDAGVSMKKILQELQRIGRASDNVRALFITHEHTDHILSAGAIARKLRIPVYATKNTWRAMIGYVGKIDMELVFPVEPGKTIYIDDMSIDAFPIPHDAAEPVGYSFYAGGKKVTVATDIGMMDDGIFLSMSGSDAVLIESNHDVEMLQKGSYPYNLKKRIRGNLGHLSNEEAGAVCERLAAQGTHTFLLGHLSAENNCPLKALETVSGFIGRTGVKIGEDVLLEVLERGKQGSLITV